MFVLAIPKLGEEYDELISFIYRGTKKIEIEKISSSSMRTSLLYGGEMINYNAMNIIDNDDKTAWCEGESAYGIGETLYVEFENKFDINKIYIMNGYAKSKELFLKNSRVKKLKINDNTIVLNLNDDMYINDYNLNFKNTKKLRLEIIEVFKGTKYKDTSISEIKFE